MFKYFLLGLIAGFALGLASAVLMDLSATVERRRDFPDRVYEDRYDEDFKACLEKLSTAVSEFSESNRRLSSAISTGAPVPQSQAKLDSAPGISKAKAMKDAANWAEVLDKSLARALVEHGKTPFDPGVSPLLQDVSKKLREAHRQWERVDSDLDAQMKGFSARTQQYKALRDEQYAIIDALEKEQERIYEQFRAALKSLDE